MNILIVEDDQLLAKSIINEFSRKTSTNILKHLSSYDDFLKESSYAIYDIILIDICLWGDLEANNGLDILKHIRQNDTQTPIIIMSNIIQYCYLEEAFRLGAHDYLIKPFRIRELQIRIQRWFHGHVFSEFFSHEKILMYEDLHFYVSSNEFMYKDTKITLSRSNKHLLRIFLIHKKQLLSPVFLREKIWWYSEQHTTKNLRIKILRLKKQLKAHNIDHWIQTVYGQGYILEKV